MKRMIISRKTISILLMLCLCVSVLSACGGGRSSAPETSDSMTNNPEAGRDNAEDKAISEFNDVASDFSEAKDNLLELISEADELLEAMGNESDKSELISKLEEAKTASAITIPERETDVDKITEQIQNINLEVDNLCQVYEELKTIVSSEKERQNAVLALKDGIIVVSVSYDKDAGRLVSHELPSFTVDLDKIDPETGNVTHIRTFSCMDKSVCSAYLLGIGNYKALENFNSDMTLMTACHPQPNRENHIGWIDENGQFTDVSAKITTESDSDALTIHGVPRFFGDYLYFIDDSENEDDFTRTHPQIKRVPLNNLTPDAVEVMCECDNYNYNDASFIQIRPDGTVADPNDSISVYSDYHFVYYDSSMQYPAQAGYIYDWISADTCIGNGVSDSYGIYKYQLSGKKDDWYSNKTSIIPEGKDRVNRNAVVSPESNQVAFLSRKFLSTSLFLVSVDGGDPVKVQTDFSFNDDTYLIDWR